MLMTFAPLSLISWLSMNQFGRYTYHMIAKYLSYSMILLVAMKVENRSNQKCENSRGHNSDSSTKLCVAAP